MVPTSSGIKVSLASIPIHLMREAKPDFDALRSELFQYACDLIRNAWCDVRELDIGWLDSGYKDRAGLHDVFLDAIELLAGVRKLRDLRIVTVTVRGEHSIEALNDEEVIRAGAFASESIDGGHQRGISAGTTII